MGIRGVCKGGKLGWSLEFTWGKGSLQRGVLLVMSTESGDQNRPPDQNSGAEGGVPSQGKEQVRGPGGQGSQAPKGAPPAEFMPPKPAAGAKWSARTGQSVPNLPPHLRSAMEETPVETVRTLLDHEALKGVVSRNFADKEVKVAELKLAQAAEPPKPYLPIDNYKKATPCGAIWENKEGREKVSFCEQCKCQVYDFTGMELPQAEELIFKRENRRNVQLFKRQDGKFLTADCPVGIRRKRNLILAAAAGILLVVSSLVMLIMMPPPPKPAVIPEAASPQKEPEAADGHKPSSGPEEVIQITAPAASNPGTGTLPGEAPGTIPYVEQAPAIYPQTGNSPYVGGQPLQQLPANGIQPGEAPTSGGQLQQQQPGSGLPGTAPANGAQPQ